MTLKTQLKKMGCDIILHLNHGSRQLYVKIWFYYMYTFTIIVILLVYLGKRVIFCVNKNYILYYYM